MRTTLDIEIDVLQAAKELAQKEGSSAGKVISKLVRQALNGSAAKPEGKFVYKNGIPMLPYREGDIITMEHIRNLMDEEDI